MTSLRKYLKVSFRNEWDAAAAGRSSMSLVAIIEYGRHGILRRVMTCSVPYDYAALGERVGIIDPTFYRPEPIQSIISSYYLRGELGLLPDHLVRRNLK
jgi:hypothetical protein